jgi:membrane fusion protein (multidrug efflux system)
MTYLLELGMSVEIEVDAIPGVHDKAHVDSISSGTGATFALLPPDNATGNFTKIVQRVPAKIVFESSQPNLDKLRAGLSSKVAISTKG